MRLFHLRSWIFIGLVVLLAACRAGPVYNVQSTSLGAPPNATMEQVATAIKRAGSGLGWEVRDVAPGQMTGRLALRSHVAIVDINHDTRNFSIAYKDSTNLNYTGTEIHSNYNGWIQNLERAIKAQASAI